MQMPGAAAAPSSSESVRTLCASPLRDVNKSDTGSSSTRLSRPSSSRRFWHAADADELVQRWFTCDVRQELVDVLRKEAGRRPRPSRWIYFLREAL